MTPILTRVRRGERLLADGAMGTMLMARGLRAGEAPERWNLERPSDVAAISRAYVDAGADLVTTNTFGGSPLRLKAHRLEARLDEIHAAAVQLAREAADGRAAVVASIGPTGRLLKPFGDTDPHLVSDGFRRQIAAVAAAGVDAICIETMTDVEEAVLALEAAQAEAPGVAAFATMSFDVTPRGAFTIMGVSVARACTRLLEAGADIVGANCGAGVDSMVKVAVEFAGATSLPLLIQPNAGLPEQREGRLVYPLAPDAFAAQCAPLVTLAAILGGCCGTTPAHIAALRTALAH